MNTHHLSLRPQRSTLFLLGLMFSTVSAFVCGIVPGRAQDSTPGGAAPASQERQLEVKSAAHLPIKFKLKNLDKEEWARELELEVTNVSGRPIYFLQFILILPEIKGPTAQIGFTLEYGRTKFVAFTTVPEPEDVPLQPGETITLKIPERDREGWETFARNRGLDRSEPKKVQLLFHTINFGDGTGFQMHSGRPINIHKKQSS